MIDLNQFRAHLREVSAVYASISKKIEELVITANELSSNEEEIKSLAARVESFLQKIRDFVSLEKKQAKKLNWSDEKKENLIRMINRELIEINNLIDLMDKERKKPANQLITRIYQLNKAVQKIIRDEDILISLG